VGRSGSSPSGVVNCDALDAVDVKRGVQRRKGNVAADKAVRGQVSVQLAFAAE
jgi:mRNA-degrading endonuclease toxin of MazEF toxin-antitoxin module